MKTVIAWILIGFAGGLALALPAKAWALVGLVAAALVFSLGIWALGLIIRGAVRAWKEENR